MILLGSVVNGGAVDLRANLDGAGLLDGCCRFLCCRSGCGLP